MELSFGKKIQVLAWNWPNLDILRVCGNKKPGARRIYYKFKTHTHTLL